MKKVLVVMLASLSMSAFASTVVGSNYFPGYGQVSSDLVCLTGNGVKADIPASQTEVCVKYSQGFGGATCAAYKTVTKSARHLEAPMSFEKNGCVAYKDQFNGSLNHEKVCVKYGTYTYQQPRAYTLVTVEKEDVFHDRLVSTRHDIPTCQ